ncbi:KICSTOR complex protein kaptin-like [Agrilus planipennis]|uniref:KICSTOR complex protein kaptin-like n=1 Tax=Agrilus planipennis TaxID=224129 RepID=A0A7F5RBT1_AGRPL|nr:KICSTOR complex protein kaptin-like [Agrilus planipennis]
MNYYKDCHFVPLSSQGNIYTSSCIKLANGFNKLLLAALKREVICFEYQENSSGNLYSTTKHISFTYIPSGAEIISLDAFNKSENGNDFVFGITIIKKGFDLNSTETYYLNIYSEWEESADLNIESISQNCLNIELKFVPYHLTHTYLISNSNAATYKKEVVFLLSGSDIQIHVYRENQTKHTYKEIDSNDYFPEFSKLPSVVTWIDVFYYENDKERLTAFGCECGYFRICKVSVDKKEVIFRFSTQLDNIISNVRIFTENDSVSDDPKISKIFSFVQNEPPNNLVLNVLVTNTLLPSVIFKDVLNYGLKKYTTLPKFETTGVITCSEVADIDFDGNKEILFGTSTQVKLFF